MPDDEIDLLLFQAEARLEAAHHLLKTGFYDDAVSRAYYSMYFAATAMFLARGIRVKTHRGLVARFGREFVETGLLEAHFGRILRIAEELRSEADYSISRQISDEEAAASVEDAERFLGAVAMSNWRRRTPQQAAGYSLKIKIFRVDSTFS